MADLIEIRCRGCRRRLGYGPADFRIYCDAWCAADYPAVPAEGRDALIDAIYHEFKTPKAVLAREFDVSRQRVDQILMQRDIRQAA